MPAPLRKTLATSHPGLLVQITDDGSRTLVHADTDVAYHSGSGALAETKHVYFHNSAVADRLARGMATRVLEVGLGTAMGMLLTIDAAKLSGTSLSYTALESQLLPASLISQLQPWDWTSDHSIVDQFLQWRGTLPDIVPDGSYDWRLDQHRNVRIRVGDARQWSAEPDEWFHAIYFDPFAPQHDSGLWQRNVLQPMHDSLYPGGRLVTYCVNRDVRDTLSAIGFELRVVRGPDGGKRDVLIAIKTSPAATT